MRKRRREQRKSPHQPDLGVAVRTEDGSVYPGRIALVSNEFVSIAFRVLAAPEAEEGGRVKLLFRSLKGGELTAMGRLAAVGEVKGGERHFEFSFEARDRTDEEPHARESDDESDNRREAFRVDLPRQGLEVMIRPYGDPDRSVLRQLADLRAFGEHSTVRAWIDDLSADGIGVICADASKHPFERGDHVEISFGLPGNPETLVIGAHVQHHMHVRLGLRYGLRFDRGSTAHFHLMQTEVLEFVMIQQRKNLRGKAS